MEPEYPYGLCISLCKDELEKLGIKIEDYKIGDVIALDAVTKVKAISQDDQGYDRLELQITELGIETEDDHDAKPVARNTGDILYGKSE
jgi:hypothetical protein